MPILQGWGNGVINKGMSVCNKSVPIGMDLKIINSSRFD